MKPVVSCLQCFFWTNVLFRSQWINRVLLLLFGFSVVGGFYGVGFGGGDCIVVLGLWGFF